MFEESCWGAVGGGCQAVPRGSGQWWPQGQNVANESQAGWDAVTDPTCAIHRLKNPDTLKNALFVYLF